MGIIKANDVTFEYIRRDEEGNVEGITTAVDAVSLSPLSIITGGPGVGKTTVVGGVLKAKIARRGKSTGRAGLHFTADPETPDAKRWCERANKRKWLEAPAGVDGDEVVAEIPAGARQAFLSLYERDEGRVKDLC